MFAGRECARGKLDIQFGCCGKIKFDGKRRRKEGGREGLNIGVYDETVVDGFRDTTFAF